MFLQAATVPELIEAILAPRKEITPGGALIVEESVKHVLSKGVLWNVVAKKHVGQVCGRTLQVWEIEGDDQHGWNAISLDATTPGRPEPPAEIAALVQGW